MGVEIKTWLGGNPESPAVLRGLETFFCHFILSYVQYWFSEGGEGNTKKIRMRTYTRPLSFLSSLGEIRLCGGCDDVFRDNHVHLLKVRLWSNIRQKMANL